MTRLAKLYRKMLDKRGLSFAEFCRLLEAFGYVHVRTNGSHIAYHHKGIGDTRIVRAERMPNSIKSSSFSISSKPMVLH